MGGAKNHRIPTTPEHSNNVAEPSSTVTARNVILLKCLFILRCLMTIAAYFLRWQTSSQAARNVRTSQEVMYTNNTSRVRVPPLSEFEIQLYCHEDNALLRNLERNETLGVQRERSDIFEENILFVSNNCHNSVHAMYPALRILNRDSTLLDVSHRLERSSSSESSAINVTLYKSSNHVHEAGDISRPIQACLVTATKYPQQVQSACAVDFLGNAHSASNTTTDNSAPDQVKVLYMRKVRKDCEKTSDCSIISASDLLEDERAFFPRILTSEREISRLIYESAKPTSSASGLLYTIND